MPESSGAMPLRSTEPNADLTRGAVYERMVEAGVDAVWENVFDWEHLPWLHAQAFSSIELRASGDWGWHADVGMAGGFQAEIELVADREAGRYVARTRSGAGAPGEIWTTLESRGPDRTAVRVEFWLPALPVGDLERLGQSLATVYRGLWDQDEEMIRTRLQAKAARARRDAAPTAPPEARDLGEWTALRPRLPLAIEFAGHRFRVVELDGRPVAHAVECPHWLGPLDGCVVEQGEIACPWHGYRFDVASGQSTDGRGLRLRPAPRLEVDPADGHLRIRSDS